MAISAALPRPGVHPWPMDTIPDPEVSERPTRRRFGAAYKVAILDELDRATAPGTKGAIIRREGLYSSHITERRRLRALGGLEALGRARGRHGARIPIGAYPGYARPPTGADPALLVLPALSNGADRPVPARRACLALSGSRWRPRHPLSHSPGCGHMTTLPGFALLEARNISKTFRSTSRGTNVVALKDVSLAIGRGEIYGLVGESGSGKSTLGRILIGIETPTSGEVLLHGERVATRADLFAMRRQVQYVFQDPFGSLPASMTIGSILEDPLIIHGLGDAPQRRQIVRELIEQVGLKASDLSCYPAVFSGGQRQRISLARALVTKPSLVICDEIVSGLDVSVQAQILNLLLDLHRDLGIAYLFVSHDLRVVRYLSERVGVMRHGELVEERAVDDLFDSPEHPYTRTLLAAVPAFDRPMRVAAAAAHTEAFE